MTQQADPVDDSYRPGQTHDPGHETDSRVARMRLEAVLLLAKTPLSLRKLCQMAHLADATEVRTLIRQLNRTFEEYGRAIRVEQVAGGYRLLTRPVLAPWLARLGHLPVPVRLSIPMMETLAVVAYRQPVSRANAEAVRGVGCGELLRQLLERDLVRIVGRSQELGRPYLYGTTKRFLQLFGLPNTDALPAIQWQTLQEDTHPEESPLDELSTSKKELVVSTTVVPTVPDSGPVVPDSAVAVLEESDVFGTRDAAKAVIDDDADDDESDDESDDDWDAEDDDESDDDWDADDDESDDDLDADGDDDESDDDWDDEDDWDTEDDDESDDDLDADGDESDDDELDDDLDADADDDLDADADDDLDADGDESDDDELDDDDDDDGGWEEVDDEVGDEEFEDDDDEDETWEEQDDDDEDWN